MAIYAAIQHFTEPEKKGGLLPLHLDYLREARDKGKIHATGPFLDGEGGLIFYIADSVEEARQLVHEDPFVKEKIVEVEIREWEDYINKL
jgi:uncharacterized protein